ncbi:hypothetical protein CYMTET_30216 [Cymbomonas tetramitiformis]|uniref:Uncharacterized protein n=1 Tax=Cymbomonas tetramitiformis TaxID=36881 RepID=A0AAE0FJI8_9CHLO|nr:hypothetical protein CYMTET_30216 [Cymbomonas tetramitiformis]
MKSHPVVPNVARGEESDNWMEGLFWTLVDLICPTQGMSYGLIHVSTDLMDTWVLLCLSGGILCSLCLLVCCACWSCSCLLCLLVLLLALCLGQGAATLCSSWAGICRWTTWSRLPRLLMCLLLPAASSPCLLSPLDCYTIPHPRASWGTYPGA